LRRLISKIFLIWFFGLALPIVAVLTFWFGMPLSKEFIELILLASLTCLTFMYLIVRLYAVYPVAAMISGIIIWTIGFLYIQFYRNIDPRVQSIHILIVLLVISIAVHFTVKRSPPR